MIKQGLLQSMVFLVFVEGIFSLSASDSGNNSNIQMDSAIQSGLGRWWTDEDLDSLRTGNLESILHPFNFSRNSPEEQPVYIGTGVFGGYIDGLGSNSDTYAENMDEGGNHLRLGFQTITLFNPDKRYQLKSRTYNPRLVVQPLIENVFDPDLMANYRQTESLWNAEVVTEFDYERLHLKIKSTASWTRAYLVFIHAEITNNGSKPVPVQIEKRITDSLSFGICEGKMFILDKLEDVRIAAIDTYYSRVKAVCNKTSPAVNLKCGETIQDVSYFSVTTDRDQSDSETVVRKAMRSGYALLHREHLDAVHERWRESMILIPDWHLQRLYFQTVYLAIGNTGGNYPVMGASLLGGCGWSGTSYVFDSYMAYHFLLRSGHHDRIKNIFHKILEDIRQSEIKFVGFSFDDNPTVGSGRYRNERHESAACPMLFYLMLQYGRMTNNHSFIKDELYPVMKEICVYFTESLKLINGTYRKHPEYVYEDHSFILRSLESDRRRRWFTDLAIAYKYLLLQKVELGRTLVHDADHQTLDRLVTITSKIYIPQTEDFYQMYAGDRFPHTPRDGWCRNQWNFHTACLGAYPFGNLLDDPKCMRSVQYPYYGGRNGWCTSGGGYPVITHFAAARLGLLDFLEKLLYDTSAVAYSNKVNVHTGNSISDTDNFLMAHTAFSSLVQEMVLNIHNSVIRPFYAIIPLFRQYGVCFYNLPASHGIRMSSEIDRGNFILEMGSPVDQQVSVELPAGIASVRIFDQDGKSVSCWTRKAASTRNELPIETVIVDFNLKKNRVFKLIK
jgi:hypothetical protein